MNASLIFPNQLFYPNPALSKNRPIYIFCDPLFFKDRQYPVNFHKQKLLLHLLSIGEYEKELKEYGYDVWVIDGTKSKNSYFEDLFSEKSVSHVHYADPNDYVLEQRLNKSIRSMGIDFTIYDSPGFINSKSEVESYFFNKKKLFMASFYKDQRRNLNILMDKEGQPIGGKWSFDEDNRKRLPHKMMVPEPIVHSFSEPEMRKAKKTILNDYPSAIGSFESFNYPVSRSQALLSFRDFLNNRAYLFGDYEDAISQSHKVIFHGVITPYLNIGLLTPMQIVNEILEFSTENNIPLNSLEGFIRQVIGWREFIRGVYASKGSMQRTKNYWNFTKTIPSSFYNGSTGIKPIDDVINTVYENAYCHHIERLMLLGNIMCLLEYDPDEVYRWFMEMFIDSYDWVMVPNVYGMSQYADGGVMSTKPYISGSNYILKMSDYKKGDWSAQWDALYWSFINNHRSFFLKNPRMSMMVRLYDKKPDDMKKMYNETLTRIEL